MPDWIAVVLLGIVEGITELLPVSSTGHLLIVEHMGWLPDQSDLFNIVIQSGAVLAVLPLFPDRVRQLLFGWRAPETRVYFGQLLLAFVITGIGGLIIDRMGFKLPETLGPVAWAVLIGGVLFVVVEMILRGRSLTMDVTWGMAIGVGLAQLVAAVFPGTSRSGATILLCLVLGLARPMATEFCFLVGIPTMLAAGGLKIMKALMAPAAGAPPEHWGLVALGFAVSAIVSFLSVKWLLGYIRTHSFAGFGWYRIALGLLILLLMA